jgi:non-ribosomal peptide synthetase component F
LACQYQDFAGWQRKHFTEAFLATEVEHWRTRLAGVEPLALPTDRPRPTFQTTRGASFRFAVPAPTVATLEALARDEGATLFMAALAGFQAMLGQWSGQHDFTVGSPIANRTRAELEPMVGCFINTLTLRADLSGSPSFRQLVRRCRETALDAYSHQDVPFERLVEALVPERDPSTPALIQVLFTLHNLDTAKARLGDLQLTARRIPITTAKLDLTLTLAPSPSPLSTDSGGSGSQDAGGLVGTIEYNRDLFDSLTIERFGQRLVRFLGAATAAPDEPIVALPWLGEDERATLARWARSEGSWQDAPDIVTAIQRMADHHPEQPAVVTTSGTVTYRELRQRASRLARKLRELPR